MLSRADYSIIRSVYKERGRIATLKMIRTWTGCEYLTACMVLDDCITRKPWTTR